jgi:hypothetical protein
VHRADFQSSRPLNPSNDLALTRGRRNAAVVPPQARAVPGGCSALLADAHSIATPLVLLHNALNLRLHYWHNVGHV